MVQKSNLRCPTLLNIENSTEILQTERNVRINYPYYNKDNYLKFYLYDKIDVEKPQSHLDDNEFAVTVSIYKNDQSKIDGGCTIVTNGSIDTWANFNDNGYPNNAKCSYDLIIPSGFIVYVETEEWFLEPFDTVSYFDESSNEYRIFNDNFNDRFFYGNKNGKDKIINWTFTSDASIYSLGFSLNFQKYGQLFLKKEINTVSILVCDCSNSTIFIQNFTDSLCVVSFAGNQDCHQTYCPDLKCNYTLIFDEIYHNETFYIDFRIDTPEISDIFKVFTNNVIVFTSNKTTRLTDGQIFIPPIFLSTENENTIKINSFNFSQSDYSVTISIIIPETLPFIYHITLSNDMPYHVVDVNDEYSGISVEYDLHDPLKNVTIQAYNAYSNFWFYKNETFNEYIRYCGKADLNCEVNLKKFSILTKYQNFVVFHLSDVHQVGCVFKQYIFSPDGNETISVMSNLNGNCKILIFLYSSSYIIKSLWTNAKEKNVTVSFGANEQKYFFEFNQESASKWENMLLATRIYTFEIPPNSSMLISLAFQPYYFYGDYVIESYNTITISKYPFKSLLASYDYGINRNYEEMFGGINVTYILLDHLYEYTLEFKVIHFNLSDSFECYFVIGNQKQDVTHLNQKFNVTKASITFNYIFDNPFMTPPHSADQGILFSVNLIRPEST